MVINHVIESNYEASGWYEVAFIQSLGRTKKKRMDDILISPSAEAEQGETKLSKLSKAKGM